jgi:hypothetical protein
MVQVSRSDALYVCVYLRYMCMCVCVYVCIYVYMYECMYVSERGIDHTDSHCHLLWPVCFHTKALC